MNNLKSILGEKKTTLNIHGTTVTLYPLKVKNLPTVLDKIHLFKDISKGNILELVSKNFSEVVELFASISNLNKEFVEELELPEMIDLVESVVELNKEGFFLIVKKLENLTEKQTGAKPSPSSSKKATLSKESRITA